MTSQQAQDFANVLESLRDAYEKYRTLQEQEHAHLNRKGAIAEWNVLVRQKHLALKAAKDMASAANHLQQQWQSLGDRRSRPEYKAVREKLSQLQALLTRILTCDRMNETLLYHGGYLQSVVAYRSASMANSGLNGFGG